MFINCIGYCLTLRRYFMSTDVVFFETTPIFPSVYCYESEGGCDAPKSGCPLTTRQPAETLVDVG